MRRSFKTTFHLSSLYFLGCIFLSVPNDTRGQTDSTWHVQRVFDFSSLNDKEIQVEVVHDINQNHLYLFEQVWKTFTIYQLNTGTGVLKKKTQIKLDWDFVFESGESFGDENQNSIFLKQKPASIYLKIDLLSGKKIEVREDEVNNPLKESLVITKFECPSAESSAENWVAYLSSHKNSNKSLLFVASAWGQLWSPPKILLVDNNPTGVYSADALFMECILERNSGKGFENGEKALQLYLGANQKNEARTVLMVLLNQANHRKDSERFDRYANDYLRIFGSYDRDMFEFVSSCFSSNGLNDKYEHSLIAWRDFEMAEIKKMKKGDLLSDDQLKAITPLNRLILHYLNTNQLHKADSISSLAVEDLAGFPKRSSMDWGMYIFWHRAKVEERLFRFTAAEEDYLKALDFKYSPWKTEIYEDLFILYLKTGDERGKQRVLKQLLELSGDKFKIKLRIADLYRDQGLYQQSEKEYQNLVNNNSLPDWQKALVLTQWGYQFQLLGNLQKAEANFRNAADLWIKVENGKKTGYMNSNTWLFNCYSYFGEKSKAEKVVLEELELAVILNQQDSERYLEALLRYAYFQFSNQELLKAEEVVNKLIENLKNINIIDYRFIDALDLKVRILRGKKDFVQAEKLIEETVKEAQKHSAQSRLPQLYNLHASICEELKKTNKAEELYVKVLVLQRQQFGKENVMPVVEAKEQLSRFYWRTSQLDKADQVFTDLFLSYKKLTMENFAFMTGSEKSKFYTEMNFRLDVYNWYAKNRAKTGYFWKEYLSESVIFSKSLFLNLNKNFRTQIYQQKDSSLHQDMKRWLDLRTQLFNLQLLTKHELTQTKIDLNELENQIEVLEKALVQRTSSFKFFKNKSIGLKEITEALKLDEAVVAIVQIPDFNFDSVNSQGTYVESSYSAIILFPNKEISVIDIGTSKNVRKSYLFYRNMTTSKVIDSVSYTRLWSSIDKLLQSNGVRRIFLSADGVYSQINVSSLLGNNGYVADYLEITNVNGLQDILTLDQTMVDFSKATMTIVANPDFTLSNSVPTMETEEDLNPTKSLNSVVPDQINRAVNYLTLSSLPGTQSEANEIETSANLRGLQVKLLSGKESSESNVKSQNPGLLHIATHGYFLTDSLFFGKDVGQIFQKNPMLQSGLMLTGSQQALVSSSDDGLLTAAEVTGMNLSNTYLTVLSACETGLGNLLSGEGVYGLSRAFQIAGSKSVLVSLWKVDDLVTAQLISTFYANLFSGDSLQIALDKAQKTIRQKFPEIYYWGAFILIRS